MQKTQKYEYNHVNKWQKPFENSQSLLLEFNESELKRGSPVAFCGALAGS